MKFLKTFALVGVLGSLLMGSSAKAGGSNLLGGLLPPILAPVTSTLDPAKLTPEIKALLVGYDAAREKYLAQQKTLLEKLKGASDAERDAIRNQLQTDRQAFLIQVAAFRTQLKTEVADTIQRLHNEELNRLINEGKGGGGDHKGH